ncbi:MAG: hypothetical protein LC789_15515 [Actinobacteria bacterium]|nr:hypothetical protein [Actinomycetota bacterium]MCA1720051.1 hypothetical protein [Actinomycetota bacterium]
MSQDTFPFEADHEVVAYEDGTEPDRKKLLVAGGVVAALVLGAGAYLFLGGSGDTEDVAYVPVRRAPRPVAAAPKVVKPAKKLPVAYKEQLGRDPFKALYVAPAAAPAAAAPVAAPVAPTTTTTTTTTGTTSTGTGTAPLAPVTKRYTLKLVSISKPNPEVRFTTWTVDGEKKTVLPAQRFGKYGELVVLAFSKNAQGEVDKAVLQVGDDSPIEVKVGESNSVL